MVRDSKLQHQDDDNALEWGRVSEVMLRNIPSRCREHEVIGAVAELGFGQRLQKMYLPVHRNAEVSFNRGYAFLGFDSPEVALAFRDAMRNYSFRRRSSKMVTVHPVRPHGESAFEHASVSIVKDCTYPEFMQQVRLAQQRQQAGSHDNRVVILRTSF
mmetsp:Transcript_825/g.1586  ORF Transcript_825/g.1586 Transcript_825/m.1586 type:complete len:158 (-) Transcript_825:85-558(-)